MKRALFASSLRHSLVCKVKPGSKLLTMQTRTRTRTQMEADTQLQAGMQLQAEAEIWLQLQLQCEMLVQVFVYNLCTSWPGVSHVS